MYCILKKALNSLTTTMNGASLGWKMCKFWLSEFLHYSQSTDFQSCSWLDVDVLPVQSLKWSVVDCKFPPRVKLFVWFWTSVNIKYCKI